MTLFRCLTEKRKPPVGTSILKKEKQSTTTIFSDIETALPPRQSAIFVFLVWPRTCSDFTSFYLFHFIRVSLPPESIQNLHFRSLLLICQSVLFLFFLRFILPLFSLSFSLFILSAFPSLQRVYKTSTSKSLLPPRRSVIFLYFLSLILLLLLLYFFFHFLDFPLKKKKSRKLSLQPDLPGVKVSHISFLARFSFTPCFLFFFYFYRHFSSKKKKVQKTSPSNLFHPVSKSVMFPHLRFPFLFFPLYRRRP